MNLLIINLPASSKLVDAMTNDRPVNNIGSIVVLTIGISFISLSFQWQNFKKKGSCTLLKHTLLFLSGYKSRIKITLTDIRG